MIRFIDLVTQALGTHLAEDIELRERVLHVRAAASIGIVCGLAFAAFNLATPGMSLLGFAELACVMLLFVPAALLVNQERHIAWAEGLLIWGALCISSALIVLGGLEGTGLFWVYSVPFMVFFIKGQRQGWYYASGCFVWHILCVTLIVPHWEVAYPYSEVVRLHFILSMGFYLLIAAAFNHARSRFETALQERKNEAEAASQAKSRFLAAASHDLRQPAHALGLFVARLKQLPNDAQTRELVEGVDASVHALQDMLDAFFDYSRLDAQITHAQVRSFELNTMFDNLRSSFAATASDKGLRLRIRPTRAWVQSDPVLLHRILLNLLSNAVQHTARGSLLLSCRPSAQTGLLRIQVRDSGIGIAAEHQQKVFEEFYQVQNPERDRSKGLGLGLSIVERSCKLLNHGMALRSNLGRGSTFTLTLPLAEPAALPADSGPQEGVTRNELAGMHVLLIEDDVLGRAALAGLLQSWDCSVVEAGSASHALLHWDARRPPDFIVSDYRLLGAHNGVDAVRQLRQIAGHEIPACVISGDTDAAVKDRIQAAGLVLLQKPVKPAKLRSVLRHAWSLQQFSALALGAAGRLPSQD
jgi:signal transduction histidine kinase/ActR/RegA family two-component response regulator